MAQVFFNAGLTVMLNQIIAAAPTAYNTNLYVGLFTNMTASTIMSGTATFGSTASSSYVVEQSGSGYTRQNVTFGAPATASTSKFSTTLGATANSGSWVITVASTSNMAVGMNITVGTEAVKVITGFPAAGQVTLSSSISSTQALNASVTGGDAVNGVKSLGASVTFTSTGAWTASNGFFVATGSTAGAGTLLYAANFADASSPAPNPNDTLTVTPTWLLSN